MCDRARVHPLPLPPINIPLLWGNLRSSRELQFTQLRSMWTKSLHSLPDTLFSSHSPVLALHFPLSLHRLLCYCVFLTFSPPTLLPLSLVLSASAISCTFSCGRTSHLSSNPDISPLLFISSDRCCGGAVSRVQQVIRKTAE